MLERFVLATTRSDDATNSDISGDPGTDQKKVADFLTTQSLTYSGALLAIGVIWNLATGMGGIFATAWTPGVLAALVIIAGIAHGWADFGDTGKRISAVIIGAFNAALLMAGALGITTALPAPSSLTDMAPAAGAPTLGSRMLASGRHRLGQPP